MKHQPSHSPSDAIATWRQWMRGPRGGLGSTKATASPMKRPPLAVAEGDDFAPTLWAETEWAVTQWPDHLVPDIADGSSRR